MGFSDKLKTWLVDAPKAYFEKKLFPLCFLKFCIAFYLSEYDER
jgi:hypothetical protein